MKKKIFYRVQWKDGSCWKSGYTKFYTEEEAQSQVDYEQAAYPTLEHRIIRVTKVTETVEVV